MVSTSDADLDLWATSLAQHTVIDILISYCGRHVAVRDNEVPFCAKRTWREPLTLAANVHSRLQGGELADYGTAMIQAVLFDFGGVITTSPFEAFAA